jgi:hypothetical protein
LRRGDVDHARSLLEASLRRSLEEKRRFNAVETLEAFARLAASQDQSERAARLYGAARMRARISGYAPATVSPA